MFRTPSSFLQRRAAVLAAMLALSVPALSTPSAVFAEDAPGVEALEAGDQESWWTPWYLVDYGVIAAGTTLFIVGEEVQPTGEALIGPVYRDDDPGSLYVSAGAETVDRPYLAEGHGETVPKEWVIGAMGAAVLYLGALEGHAWADGSGSAQQFHDTMIGFLEATALTAGATNVLKASVGRLRPDFGSRAKHHLCTGEPPPEMDCDGYQNSPLSEDPVEADRLFLDGRRSFVSGHSSNSFSLFGYTSLVIGGHYVWGDDATPRSRAAGIAAQSVLMASASFIAASRLIDGRHHVTDVLTGAGLGLALANFSYWRRFGLDGNPRADSLETGSASELAFDLGPAPNGAGLQLTVRH